MVMIVIMVMMVMMVTVCNFISPSSLSYPFQLSQLFHMFHLPCLLYLESWKSLGSASSSSWRDTRSVKYSSFPVLKPIDHHPDLYFETTSEVWPKTPLLLTLKHQLRLRILGHSKSLRVQCLRLTMYIRIGWFWEWVKFCNSVLSPLPSPSHHQWSLYQTIQSPECNVNHHWNPNDISKII